jgi:hypothetical protein
MHVTTPTPFWWRGMAWHPSNAPDGEIHRGAFSDPHKRTEAIMSEQDFYDAYDRLADDGKCDSAGGSEYRRVLGEWKAAGRPETGLDAFIVARANIGPFDGHAAVGRHTMN